MKPAEVYIESGLSDTLAGLPATELSVSRVPNVYTHRMSPWRWGPVVTFLCGDVAALGLISGILSVAYNWNVVLKIAPLFGLLGIAFVLSGLYEASTMHPAEEIRRATIVTNIFFAACLASFWVVDATGPFPVRAWTVTWLLSVVSLPTCRAILRVLISRTSWWGIPVVVLSAGDAGEAVVRTLKRWPELGFKPVALLQDDLQMNEIEGVPVLGKVRLAPNIATRYRIPCAIIASPGLEHRQLVDLLGQYTKFFKRVFVIPSIRGSSALWSSGSYAGLMGYGVRHNVWSRWGRFSKRIVDLIGATIGLIVLAPIFGLIALLIKLDSRGPVFYTQLRMGQGGKCFNVLKFRTMFQNADAMLEEILQNDPASYEEYEVYRKLRDDPRVTRVGKILRRYSLDELPQIFNVLMGHMSIVGPRAYLPKEISHMEGLERIVLQNRPGITGLWQVSGRNLLSFEERVDVDVHYVHHWTPWVDLYILARTIPVVLTGEGAC